MYYITEISCVIIELWMIDFFLRSFFEKRSHAKWLSTIFYLTFGIILTVLSLIPWMVMGRLLCTVIGVLTASLLLFRAKPVSGLISGIVFCAFFAVTDLISALIFQMMGIANEALMESTGIRSLYLVICHILMFGMLFLICLITQNKKRNIPFRILLPVVPCWMISVVLCLLLTWQCFAMRYELHPMFLLVLLGLQYTNIMVIYYTNRLHDQNQEKKEWEIAEHHYAMQQEYYDQLRSQQEETRALWHDISKYLRASRTDSSDKAMAQVQEMLDGINCVVDVNNRVVSVILNEYLNELKQADIRLLMEVNVPNTLFVTAADLYVLIGNTMDNAIEACQELPTEDRNISLKLRVHNNILYYEISNPFLEAHAHRVRNRYHGYGLKNVQRCVEKYRGNMTVSKENHIFKVTAYLNSI